MLEARGPWVIFQVTQSFPSFRAPWSEENSQSLASSWKGKGLECASNVLGFWGAAQVTGFCLTHLTALMELRTLEVPGGNWGPKWAGQLPSTPEDPCTETETNAAWQPPHHGARREWNHVEHSCFGRSSPREWCLSSPIQSADTMRHTLEIWRPLRIREIWVAPKAPKICSTTDRHQR